MQPLPTLAWPYHLGQATSSITHFPRGTGQDGRACHEPPGHRRQQRAAAGYNVAGGPAGYHVAGAAAVR